MLVGNVTYLSTGPYCAASQARVSLKNLCESMDHEAYLTPHQTKGSKVEEFDKHVEFRHVDAHVVNGCTGICMCFALHDNGR